MYPKTRGGERDRRDRENRRQATVAPGRLPVPSGPEAREREHERRHPEGPERREVDDDPADEAENGSRESSRAGARARRR